MRPFRVFLGLCLFSLSACDNPESAANQLYVEASTSASRASSEKDPLTRYTLLQSAARNVQRITTDFSSTPAALRIAANENIGPYTHAGLQQALADAAATPTVCSRDLTRKCFTDIIEKSLTHLATHDTDDTPETNAAFDTAILGLPYLSLLNPQRPAAILSRKAELLSGLTLDAADKTLPAALFATYQTHGAEPARQALSAFVADNPDTRQHVLSNFHYGYTSPFAASRTPTAYKDLALIASAIADPLTPQIKDALASSLCQLASDPALSTQIVSDCPALAITRFSSYNYSTLPEEQVEALYSAAPADKKRDIASGYFGENYAHPEVQLRWLARAGKAADIEALSGMYTYAIDHKLPLHPAIIPALANLPEKSPATALSQAGVSRRNLTLLHAQGTFKDQLPAVLKNLRAVRGYTYEVEDLIDAIQDLMAITPGIDITPFVETVSDITGSWAAEKEGTRDSFRMRLALILIYDHPGDPLPLLQRLYGPQLDQTDLPYGLLERIKDAGHSDFYTERMNRPATNAAFPPATARLVYHFRKIREQGNTEAFLAEVAALSPEDRIIAFENALTEDTRAKRTPMYEAALAKYPADFFVEDNNSISGFALTPRERGLIFIDHAPEITARLANNMKGDWIPGALLTLDEADRDRLQKAVAAHLPAAWIQTAGWIILSRETQTSATR